MANPEHLEILEQGVSVWNRWRHDHQEIYPDLSRESFVREDLTGIDFREANLRFADFGGADLRYVNLYHADLIGTNLSEANLSDADLTWAHMTKTNLEGAALIRARLWVTEIIDSKLRGADLNNEEFIATKIGGVDLSEVLGLKEIFHRGPSEISISTFYQSKGLIPETFLQGCGVPEHFITYLRKLAVQPVQFYTCFISYSSGDQDFAERLHGDLQDKGVRCWYAPKDLKIGAEIRTGIDKSIHLHDKLLLVLSETSVKSQWVQQEVETALAKERELGQMVLFPIRLDDAVMQINAGWPAYLKNARNIGDFTRWKDRDSYQKAFDRLLRDLKAEDKP